MLRREKQNREQQTILSPPQEVSEETEKSLEGNSDEAALPVSTPVLNLPYARPHGNNLVQQFKSCLKSFMPLT